MKAIKNTALLAASCLLAGAVYIAAQEGPQSQSSETVAKPKKKDTTSPDATGTTSDGDLPKIPSKFNPKDKVATEGLPTFKSDVTTVQVDVAVLDNKGRFIPRIPRGNFRILEDGQPQQVSGFTVGNEAPMTVAMVIEFSNRFQRYYSQGWYQTLVATYGFVDTVKPDDYIAIIAYDLRSEILTDFTTDHMKLSKPCNVFGSRASPNRTCSTPWWIRKSA
jgi:Ca-activated chloride channel family protein